MVAIFLDQTTYSIFENEQVVTVTLRLNETYRDNIVVYVAVGELQGGCIQERSDYYKMQTVVGSEVWVDVIGC